MTRPPPQALLIDLDGVLFQGDRPLPGAARLLGRLAGRPHCFVTNNPIRTPEQIAAACVAMGLPRPDPRYILTSALATARWLSRERPGLRYFAVGAGGLEAALSAVGSRDERDANAVVVGEGVGLDFATLTTGINLILGRGARLIATNPDTTVDGMRDGQRVVLPGCGALVAPFTAATGVTPTFIGKPEPLLYEMALAQLGLPAAACLMIGDRPDTDIVGAVRLGIRTALVRTGRFPPGRDWVAGLPRPDFDAPDLDRLIEALDRAFPGLLTPL
ncbi:HAD-IIA family hydrolase [Candidatus Thiodictyon syntrophicum]|jgi:HAD superfamily hydrolase (TIGR01450 family)|uniref:Haloacid dehalogenase n=1 Tax=Candidatus Thiodictyon syntrophicum TaxID=1166950 RepID=A0A2K8U241_9GAMM|nr:HAD-IIA family hydrolase [Candidatus Thiodictyon syntrophicum]AUB79646.1 haloacid dehalogenase [Candidatus Thiodictyon syntrophicum]